MRLVFSSKQTRACWNRRGDVPACILLVVVHHSAWCLVFLAAWHGIARKKRQIRSEHFAYATGDIANYAPIISVLDGKQKEKKKKTKRKQIIEADLTYATDPFHLLCTTTTTTTTTGVSDLDIAYDVTHASERFLLLPPMWKYVKTWDLGSGKTCEIESGEISYLFRRVCQDVCAREKILDGKVRERKYLSRAGKVLRTQWLAVTAASGREVGIMSVVRLF